jgi:hypothetical protein
MLSGKETGFLVSPGDHSAVGPKNEKHLSRDLFKDVKSKELKYNTDSIHAILTNFTCNYREIILRSAFSV